MDKEVVHIGMNNLTCTGLLLYHLPLFFIVFLFLTIDAQVTFDMFVEHLVVIIDSNWTFRSQTIFFESFFFFTIICNHFNQLKFLHSREKKILLLRFLFFWILKGFCFMDVTSKDGSKVNLIKETWVEKLVKAIATT